MEISDLVDDILLSIFERLSIVDKIRTERVCRRWRRLSLKSWQKVRTLRLADLFEMDNEFITVRNCNRLLLQLLKRGGSFIRTLDLSDSNDSHGILTDVDEKTVRALGRYCTNVSVLNLSYVPLTNVHLKILSSYCSNLTTLKLVQCFEYELTADDGLGDVLAKARKLYVLDLSLNDTLDGRCFERLECVNLESVILNNCFKLKFSYLEQLAKKCRKLKRLDLAGYSSTLASVLPLLTNLECLNLNMYEGDESTGRTLENLHRLQQLDIGHSSLLTDETIVALATGCPSLSSLNLSGKFGRVTNHGLKQLAYCRCLAELDISWLDNVNDKSLLKIAKNGTLHSLHAHLGLGLTEDGLLRMVRLCPNFYFLDVTSCSQIGENFFNALSQLCVDRKKPLTVHVSADQITSTGLERLNHVYFCAFIVG